MLKIISLLRISIKPKIFIKYQFVFSQKKSNLHQLSQQQKILFSDLQKIKKILQGNQQQIKQSKQFFNTEQQKLSFQLMKVQSISQILSIVSRQEYRQQNYNANLLYLIFYRYINFIENNEDKIKLDKTMKQIFIKILKKADTLEEEMLQSLYEIIVRYKIYQEIQLPNPPFINNPSNKSPQLLLYLLQLYSIQHHKNIYTHYQIKQAHPHNLSTLLKIFLYFPSDKKLLDLINKLIKQCKQQLQSGIVVQQIINSLIISLHNNKLHLVSNQLFYILNFQSINFDSQVHIFYNLLTSQILKQNIKSILNIITSKINNHFQLNQVGINQIKCYRLLWNCAILLFRNSFEISLQKFIKQLVTIGHQFTYDNFCEQDIFEITVNFTILITNVLEFNKLQSQIQQKKQILYLLKLFLLRGLNILEKDQLALIIIITYKFDLKQLILQSSKIDRFLRTYNGKYNESIQKLKIKRQI